MILLDGSSDSLTVTLGASSDVDVHASYTDRDGSTYTPGRKNTNITGTSPTAIVSAPSGSVQRTVKTVAIRNTTSTAVAVTVTHDSSTDVELTKVTLAGGFALHYDEHSGWRVLDGRGRVTVSAIQGVTVSGGSDFGRDPLSADDTNNNAIANTADYLDEFSIAYDATSTTKVIWFRAFIMYTAAATTTGSRWMIELPNADIRIRSEYSSSTTARITNEGVSANDIPAASSTSSAATAANIAVVEGFLNMNGLGVGGEIMYLRFASEVSSSAIVAKAGSVLHSYECIA